MTLSQFAAAEVADDLAALATSFEEARGSGRLDDAMALLAADAVVDTGYERSDNPALIREMLGGFRDEGTSRAAIVVEAGEDRLVWITEEQPHCFLERWEAAIADGQITSLTRVAPTFFTGPVDVPLDCPNGRRPPLGQLVYEIPVGDHRPPAELVEEFFAASLHNGDVIREIATDGSRPPRVGVIRDGRTVAVAYMARAVNLGLAMEVWEACDGIEPSPQALEALLSEFGEPEPIQEGDSIPIWYDATGSALARDVASLYRGPDHCDWESAHFLSLGRPLGTAASSLADRRTYVRDPKGVVPLEIIDPHTGARIELDGAFLSDATLPRHAEDTGYHSEEFRLTMESGSLPTGAGEFNYIAVMP